MHVKLLIDLWILLQMPTTQYRRSRAERATVMLNALRSEKRTRYMPYAATKARFIDSSKIPIVLRSRRRSRPDTVQRDWEDLEFSLPEANMPLSVTDNTAYPYEKTVSPATDSSEAATVTIKVDTSTVPHGANKSLDVNMEAYFAESESETCSESESDSETDSDSETESDSESESGSDTDSKSSSGSESDSISGDESDDSSELHASDVPGNELLDTSDLESLDNISEPSSSDSENSGTDSESSFDENDYRYLLPRKPKRPTESHGKQAPILPAHIDILTDQFSSLCISTNPPNTCVPPIHPFVMHLRNENVHKMDGLKTLSHCVKTTPKKHPAKLGPGDDNNNCIVALRVCNYPIPKKQQLGKRKRDDADKEDFDLSIEPKKRKIGKHNKSVLQKWPTAKRTEDTPKKKQRVKRKREEVEELEEEELKEEPAKRKRIKAEIDNVILAIRRRVEASL